MSFCRFSSDSFRSTVYCYQDTTGYYVINVANNKLVGIDDMKNKEPDVELIFQNHELYSRLYDLYSKELDTLQREDLTLQYSGEGFYGLSYIDCLNTLTMLREAGHHIPLGVEEDIFKSLLFQSAYRMRVRMWYKIKEKLCPISGSLLISI